MDESKSSTALGHSVTPTILLAMTSVTGIVDAVSYLALGRVFTANMTGNVVLLGFAFARVGGLSAARSFAALVFFFAGAIYGGKLPASRAHRALYVEVAMLLLASLAALLPQAVSVYCVIVLTAVAMGYRNAVVRKIAIPDLTTTVLTLTITGLAADSRLAGGDSPRWQRRAAAILALVIGAYIGAQLVKRSTALALLVAALITGTCALPVFRRRRTEALRND